MSAVFDMLQHGDTVLRVGTRVRVKLRGSFDGLEGRVFALLRHHPCVVVELDTPWLENGALACFEPEELEVFSGR